MADAGDYVCRSSNRDAGMIRIHILNGEFSTYNYILIYLRWYRK
jgi:hypothetical protein